MDNNNSAREIDDNGRLHVKDMPITKEQIRYYLGSELSGDKFPDGSSPIGDKKYAIFTPSKELSNKETIKSFNGSPIMDEHHLTTASNPDKKNQIGYMMNDIHYKSPYLVGTAVFNDGKAIDKIISEVQKEISADYFRRVVWQEGTYNGEHYDGYFSDIRANHVALVPRGRAGRDVRVSDAAMNMIDDLLSDNHSSDADRDNYVQELIKKLSNLEGPFLFNVAWGILRQFCPDMPADWARARIAEDISQGNSDNKNIRSKDGDIPMREMTDDASKEAKDTRIEDKDKTGEPARDFYSDKEEEMKKDGYDEKTRKMCLRMMKEAASHASGDSKDAKGCSSKDESTKEEKEQEKDNRHERKEREDWKRDDRNKDKRGRDESEEEEDRDEAQDSRNSDAAIENIIEKRCDARMSQMRDTVEAENEVNRVFPVGRCSDADEPYKKALESKFGYKSNELRGVPHALLQKLFRQETTSHFASRSMDTATRSSDSDQKSGIDPRMETLIPVRRN